MVSRTLHIRLCGALICLLTGASAAAQTSFANAESAYELLRGQVLSLPGGPTGRLSVRPCGDCEPETLTVDSDTRYYIRPAPEAVSLADWLAAERESDYRQTLIYVFYAADDRRVTRLVLDRD